MAINASFNLIRFYSEGGLSELLLKKQVIPWLIQSIIFFSPLKKVKMDNFHVIWFTLQESIQYLGIRMCLHFKKSN